MNKCNFVERKVVISEFGNCRNITEIIFEHQNDKEKKGIRTKTEGT